MDCFGRNTTSLLCLLVQIIKIRLSYHVCIQLNNLLYNDLLDIWIIVMQMKFFNVNNGNIKTTKILAIEIEGSQRCLKVHR